MEEEESAGHPGWPRLVGLGCPILDVKAAVPQAFFTSRQLGLGQFSVGSEPSVRALYEDALAHGAEVKVSAGGSTQNVIRVAQWLLSRHGDTCTFIGSVGDDSFAQLLRREVEREDGGVDFHYITTPGRMTGTCLALTLSGDTEDRRHQLFTAGASEMIQLDEGTMQMIARADHLYLECAFLSFAPDLLFELARRHKAAGKSVVVNLSNISVVKKHREAMLRLLPHADLLFAKEKEALALADDAKTSEDAAVRLSTMMLERGEASPRIVAITRGTQPTIVAHGSQCVVFPVPVVPKERVVDLIGSGDAFVGGFLAEYVRPSSSAHRVTPSEESGAIMAWLKRCVSAGHFASSEVIQHPGCTFSVEAAHRYRADGAADMGLH